MASTETRTSFAELTSAAADLFARLDDGLWQLADSDLTNLLREQHTLAARMHARFLATVREIDARGIPGQVGATSTQAFVGGTLRMSPYLAAETFRTAKLLGTPYCDTAAQLADGTINAEQAKAIVETCDGLPKVAEYEDRVAAEKFLLAQADKLTAMDLRRLGKKLDEVLDPDGKADREEAGKTKRALDIRDNHDGTQTIRWRETDENVAQVKAAMTALAAPKPAENGDRDPRTAQQRRADAMIEIVRQVLAVGDLPPSRGERPHVHVTCSANLLRTGEGFGRTATGEDLSGEAIRRIACDAELFGIVMDDQGAVLNVGRRYRSVTPAIWIALLARDVGCVFPNCPRPAYMCDAHHRIHWADGGETSLENTVLLCGAHHDAVHHKGWDIELGPDRRPQLRPPAWIDPERALVSNTYWDTQKAMDDALAPDVTDPDYPGER